MQREIKHLNTVSVQKCARRQTPTHGITLKYAMSMQFTNMSLEMLVRKRDLYGLTVAELCILPFAPVCLEFRIRQIFVYGCRPMHTMCTLEFFVFFPICDPVDSATLMFKVISWHFCFRTGPQLINISGLNCKFCSFRVHETTAIHCNKWQVWLKLETCKKHEMDPGTKTSCLMCSDTMRQKIGSTMECTGPNCCAVMLHAV